MDNQLLSSNIAIYLIIVIMIILCGLSTSSFQWKFVLAMWQSVDVYQINTDTEIGISGRVLPLSG